MSINCLSTKFGFTPDSTRMLSQTKEHCLKSVESLRNSIDAFRIGEGKAIMDIFLWTSGRC